MKRKILFNVLILGVMLLSACVASTSPPVAGEAEAAPESGGAPTRQAGLLEPSDGS